MTVYNLDGRELVPRLVEAGVRPNHVIMNLPAIAPEFLDALRPWVGGEKTRVHCYCFSTAADVEGDGRRLVEAGLGTGGGVAELTVHVVRYVATLKAMLCVEFDICVAAGRCVRMRRCPVCARLARARRWPVCEVAHARV